MVVSTENEIHQKIAEGLVKQLSAGDTVVARELYKPEREYVPQLKLFMLTNHKPTVEGGNEAIWRRIFPIPFTVIIPQEERDHKLLEKLQQEAEGVLAWAVRGCLDWQSQGLNPPNIVQQAKQDYRDESDSVALFMKACCERIANETVTKNHLHVAYQGWCRDAGYDAIKPRSFGSWLKKAGYKDDRTATERVWEGIRLKPDQDWE
jgi:putative DNA primase/helicase